MVSWRFEILSVSIYFSSACQMNIPQQVEFSPNMYVFYPTRCILFHKMYSSQGLATVFEISPLPAVLQYLSALCTSQLCCKYLHWINNIISVIHTRQWCCKYSHWRKKYDRSFVTTYPKASQTGRCFSAALSLHL